MLERIRLRVAQTARHFRRETPRIGSLEMLLTPDAAVAFASLPAGDQQHGLAIARWLQDQGASSDLVTAGLLHDIGKSVSGYTVHLTDRVAKVVLERIAPGWIDSIAAWPSPHWPLGGLWVLSRHAQVGAEMVTTWGYPERVAWIVLHHEDDQVTDPELAMLVSVDDARPTSVPMEALANG